MVKTKPGDDAAQKGLGFAYGITFSIKPAEKGLLHDILGLGDGAEHPVGDAD